MTATVTITVDEECENLDCSNDALFAYLITGDFGTDGVVVYCSEHGHKAGESENYTYLTEVGK